MKKNLLIAVLLVLVLVACVLTACRPTTCIEGHTWVDSKVITEATCTTDGKVVKTCSVCNATKEFVIVAKGHSYGDWTDNQDGLTHSRVCSTDASHVDSLEHNDLNADGLCDSCLFEIVVVPPTCEHSWVEFINNGDGTHTMICEFDETHTKVENCSGGEADCYNGAFCDYCFEEYTDALGHDWNEWESNEDGTHGRTCNNSEDCYDEDDCFGGQADCYNGAYCDVCGYEYTDALGHDWNDWESSEDGTHFRTCNNSEDCYDEDDCNCVEIGRTPADCENAEVITYGCTECGYTYTEEGEPALDHDWSDWTSNGELNHSRVCANDPSHVETERCIIDAVDFINPTCETYGYTLCVCDKCGYEHHADIIDALGHDMLTKYVVENDVLYLVTYCGNNCDLAETKTRVNGTADVSNEADLKTVLENGFNARLTNDITIYDGPIEINSGDVTLDLNGKKLESRSLVTSINALGQKLTVCDVLIVRNEGTKLRINGNGELVADNDNAESVCVLSVLDGAYVYIDNSTFRSTGCTTIYARTNSVVEIWDGTFIAEEEWKGVRYTLDILENELANQNSARIFVYGGTFVGFNPADHDGDGNYRSFVVEAESHVVYDETADAYIVETHTAEDEIVFGSCTVCGLCINYTNQFQSGDALWAIAEKKDILYFDVVILEKVDGEDTYYMIDQKSGLYFTLESMTANKADATKYVLKMDVTEDSLVFIGVPGSELIPVAMIPVKYCLNHDIQFNGTDGGCTSDAIWQFACEHCGMDATFIIAPATGHDWSDWTSNEDGTHSRVCSNDMLHVDTEDCDYVEIGRTPEDCENAEVITYQCTVCKHTKTEFGTSATGHDWDNHVANCGGTHTATCNNCHETMTENHSLVSNNSIYCVCGVTMIEKAYSVESGDTIVIVIENGDELLIMDGRGDVDTLATYFAIQDSGHGSVYYLYYDGYYLSQKSLGGSMLQLAPDSSEDTCLWTIAIDANGYATITTSGPYGGKKLTIDDGGGSFYFTLGGPDNEYTYSIYKLVDHTAEKFAHQYESNQCVCDVCGEGEHDYDAVVTEPNCSNGGYTTYTCTVCGDNYKSDFTSSVDCVEVWTDNGDGTHTVGCIYGCNYPDAGNESHVDEDGDHVCDLCEAEVVAAKQEVELKLDFSTTDNRESMTTSKAVWKQNGITLVNDKGGSSSNIADYSKPARFYKSSDITITCTGMKQIVFACNNTTYATSLQKSLTAAGYTATVSSKNVTVTFAEETDSISFRLTDAKVFIDSLTITAMQ